MKWCLTLASASLVSVVLMSAALMLAGCGETAREPAASRSEGKSTVVAATSYPLAYFAEPEDLTPGQRVFDVSLQGETILSEFDVVAEAGRARRALVKEFQGVEVRSDLVVKLRPAAGSKVATPILCGITAVEE